MEASRNVPKPPSKLKSFFSINLYWQLAMVMVSGSFILGAVFYWGLALWLNQYDQPQATLYLMLFQISITLIGGTALLYFVSHRILKPNLKLMEERKATFMRVVEMAVKAIEAKDEYTFGHAERVSVYAHYTALELGLSIEEADKAAVCGRLHDLGKVGLQDNILLKEQKLEEQEYEIIKQHPVIGEEILKPMKLAQDIIDGIAQHHEKLDGSGYPLGLSGNKISLFARIIAVCDTYDAITSNRPYRMALSHEEAEHELMAGAGSHFDLRVIQAFLAASRRKPQVWDDMRNYLHKEAGYKIMLK